MPSINDIPTDTLISILGFVISDGDLRAPVELPSRVSLGGTRSRPTGKFRTEAILYYSSVCSLWKCVLAGFGCWRNLSDWLSLVRRSREPQLLLESLLSGPAGRDRLKQVQHMAFEDSTWNLFKDEGATTLSKGNIFAQLYPQLQSLQIAADECDSPLIDDCKNVTKLDFTQKRGRKIILSRSVMQQVIERLPKLTHLGFDYAPDPRDSRGVPRQYETIALVNSWLAPPMDSLSIKGVNLDLSTLDLDLLSGLSTFEYHIHHQELVPSFRQVVPYVTRLILRGRQNLDLTDTVWGWVQSEDLSLEKLKYLEYELGHLQDGIVESILKASPNLDKVVIHTSLLHGSISQVVQNVVFLVYAMHGNHNVSVDVYVDLPEIDVDCYDGFLDYDDDDGDTESWMHNGVNATEVRQRWDKLVPNGCIPTRPNCKVTMHVV